MPFQPPGSGQGNVAEFMMSPLPYVTQSSAGTTTPTRIDFPYVSRHFSVTNTSDQTLEIGFTASGTLGGNRFTIPISSTFGPVDMRVRTMYFLGVGGTATFDLLAGMTLIATRTFPILTGSSPLALNITSSLEDRYLSYSGLG